MTERQTAGFLVLIGVAALGLAYGTQHLLGMVPCELCLWERWPYRIVLLLGALGLILPAGARRPVLWLAALALLANLGISFMHVGVEHGWWPSPLPECSASNIVTGNLSQLIANLPSHPSKPCDAPSFLIPGLPISFATMDFLFTFLCLGFLLFRLRPAR
jgi:disulfide bond formation protein DsbB